MGRQVTDSQRVTTTRVVLRAFASKDLPQLELLFSEPDVAQWNPGPDVRNREVWCAESNAGQGGNEFRTWAVADPDDDRLLGTVSVFDAHDGQGKIGYRVLTGETGRGVATEAVRAATRRGADELGLHAIWLTHAVDNDASCRVATKAGYHARATVAGTEAYGDGLMQDEHLHRHDI
jgi:RimJ/RimL family protein N-acetyltransferase